MINCFHYLEVSYINYLCFCFLFIRGNKESSCFVIQGLSSEFWTHKISNRFLLSQIPKEYQTIPSARKKLLRVFPYGFYAENSAWMSMAKAISFRVCLGNLLGLFIKDKNFPCFCSYIKLVLMKVVIEAKYLSLRYLILIN